MRFRCISDSYIRTGTTGVTGPEFQSGKCLTPVNYSSHKSFFKMDFEKQRQNTSVHKNTIPQLSNVYCYSSGNSSNSIKIKRSQIYSTTKNSYFLKITYLILVITFVIVIPTAQLT